MSEKHKNARYSQSRTDTLIGAGTRFEGNITFTGVLRTDGKIIGDVSCDDDAQGTIVVSKSGSITGAVKAPHIEVVGRVDGPLDSSESIEIHPGAYVVGDASYREIVIHEGGVIEGVLTPSFPAQEDRSGQEHRVQILEASAVKESGEPPAHAMAASNEIGKRPVKWRKFGVGVVLLIAVLAIVRLYPSLTAVTPPATAVVLKAHNAATENPAPQSAPVESATPLASPNAVAASAVALVPSSDTVSKNAVPATLAVVSTPSSPPPLTAPEPELKSVAVVQGEDPSKPGDFLYVVIGKESAVLFKKRRQDPAAGTRIDLAQGTSKRITMAKDDVLRVEQGRGLQMFYQGRKVASATIDSGAWISFVPSSRGVASTE